jgi:RNA polymerase sigma-70 factor (ECF subfamily)
MEAAAASDRERDDPSARLHLGERLVREHGPALTRYVRRLLPGDPERAEDIVQETFVRAWRHAASLALLSDDKELRAWLFRVARNLVIDWLRRHAARPVELTGVLPVTSDPWPQDMLEAVLLRHVLVDAFGALSARHRETLVQLHYLDRSQADVGAALGVPTGTVKSRNHVAVRELRAALVARGITGREAL